MRLKRIVSILLLFVLVVGCGSATILIWNRDRIIGAVLARVKDRTGLDIVASGIDLRLSSHLIVSLRQPRVLSGQRQVAAMRELRVLVSYNCLIHQHGLPLFTAILDSPRITLPAGPALAALGATARLDPDTPRQIADGLARLAVLTRRL
ncbi:MAG: hypothetical protein WA005_12710, partial [Candidatus Binataceae bacterium]